MPDLTVARRQIYFDRQLVAELHPSLAEGTSLYVDFLGTLHTGADFDHVMEEIEQRHAADIKQLEDEIGAAEEQASEALAECDRLEAECQRLAKALANAEDDIFAAHAKIAELEASDAD